MILTHTLPPRDNALVCSMLKDEAVLLERFLHMDEIMRMLKGMCEGIMHCSALSGIYIHPFACWR